MNTSQSSPTARSSPIPDGKTVVQELSRKIDEAIEKTIEGISKEQRLAHCFLPKSDLEDILNQSSLRRLAEELLRERNSGSGIEQATLDDQNAENGVLPERSRELFEANMERIINHPSIKTLLAQLLWEGRQTERMTFIDWLKRICCSVDEDDKVPFTKASMLQDLGFSTESCRAIARTQNIFRPVTIKKLLDQQFKSEDRLPYIGRSEVLRQGSSGSVTDHTIARGHWEIESHGDYVVGNPKSDNPFVIAIKCFKEIPEKRSMEEATADFEDERDILRKLRNSNVKHDMILLDWGSITIVDENNTPICHSLIFELATFSLEDFFNDERCFRTYKTQNRLLKNLADIFEALKCLHDDLQTYHLDIKPENILVFERGSSRHDNDDKEEDELTWKLTDFGLARKKNARQRTGHTVDLSSHSSGSLGLPATRHAGIYQAPEIQQRNFSRASRGSDIWSMGCVAFMLLEFMALGPKSVSELKDSLQVNFKNAGGEESLFYVRSDTTNWKDVENSTCDYVTDHEPDIGIIPGTEPQLKAAVHPKVIEHSNKLYKTYAHGSVQPLIKDILKVIFCNVLVVGHQKRSKAVELHKMLNIVQQQWQSYEERPGNPCVLGAAPEHTDNDPLKRSEATEAPKPDLRSPLCKGIEDEENAIAIVDSELTENLDQLKTPCPDCGFHPIHKALRAKAYGVLDMLLEKADRNATDIPCEDCSDQTAIQLACSDSGDSKALRSFLKHKKKFNLTSEMYNHYREGLSSEADKLLRDLCQGQRLR